MKEYFARKDIIDEKQYYQLLIKHLENVSVLCKEFSKGIIQEEISELIGILHDIGKYSEDFQRRLRGENIRVDHATAGAQIIDKIYQQQGGCNPLYRLMEYAICGHHSGLPNYGNKVYGMCKRLDNELADFSSWKTEISSLKGVNLGDFKHKLRNNTSGFTLQFYIRYIFSCLVDADRIDAQNFPFEEATKLMSNTSTIMELKDKFENYMVKFKQNVSHSFINEIRDKILKDCLVKSQGERGIYSLTVPTGGGKTLSSLAFALNHACKHNLQRIIYTIPFTSIIEQNAEKFCEILGKENILEHHSNFENPYTKEGEILKYKLARENWHEPVIVTTNVQFFETLFSNKPSKARKLHNIANSIIILDEVQTIPNKYMQPCMTVLDELVTNYNCTVVLCSATQPEFDKNKVFKEEAYIQEIIESPSELFNKLKRTTEHFIGTTDLETIASNIQEENQVLCIVNTKKHAKELFELLERSEGTFHLSTNMYPQHRKRVIKEIRKRLTNNMTCKVISTQLIEAGVDIDFPVVYRSITGIDSAVQAAGRCNREGKRSTGHVYLFQPEEKYIGKDYLALTAEIGRILMMKNEKFLGLQSISEYFSGLLDVTKTKLDAYDILGLCEEGIQEPTNIRFEFETIADRFKFIDNQGYGVIIPANEEVEGLIESIKFTKHIGGILGKLSPYTINVPRYELDKLHELGAITTIENQILVLGDRSLYNDYLGLVTTLPEDDFEYII